MSLSEGTCLGPYSIVAPLGVGGMGEVYRATDSRLKRQVAVKILPSGVAADPERLVRFQREAEVLASLNHPHIAAIYGLEDAGGVKALVMELVEGPTLADRIAQGSLPLDEALLMTPAPDEDLVALDEALTALAEIDARKSRAIELRVFGGLSIEETAEVLEVSAETVKRDCRLAKSWLLRWLTEHA